jgi:hypothetical protein
MTSAEEELEAGADRGLQMEGLYIEEEEMAGRPLNGGEHCGVGAAVR